MANGTDREIRDFGQRIDREIKYKIAGRITAKRTQRENAATVSGQELRARLRDEHVRNLAVKEYDRAIYDKHCRELAYSHSGSDIPSDAVITDKDFDASFARRSFNPKLAAYYMKYARETGDPTFKERARRVLFCMADWDCDIYDNVKVVDTLRTNYCMDRMCQCCQKQLQASRFVRYGDTLNQIAQEYDWYHLTMTIPNVPGAQLSKTMDILISGFAYLIRLFSGNLSPRWHYFVKYGYVAALRNMEITVKGDNYHPHLHAIIALRKGLEFDKHNYNAYSRSRHSDDVRLFSDFEVLLQKVWKLRTQGVKVTQSWIDGLELGYSVAMDRITDGRYGEVFKYMIKPHHDFLTYEQWKVLRKATRGRRMMQGYGALYGIRDEIDDADNPEYDLLHGQLLNSGTPERTILNLGQLQAGTKQGFAVINRKRIRPLKADDADAVESDGNLEIAKK